MDFPKRVCFGHVYLRRLVKWIVIYLAVSRCPVIVVVIPVVVIVVIVVIPVVIIVVIVVIPVVIIVVIVAIVVAVVVPIIVIGVVVTVIVTTIIKTAISPLYGLSVYVCRTPTIFGHMSGPSTVKADSSPRETSLSNSVVVWRIFIWSI